MTARPRPDDIEVSHDDRVVFPEVGLTKGDVVSYYRRVADRIVPHLRGRPLVMYRFPDGVGEDRFFQKQAPSHFPSWIDTVSVPRRSGGTVDQVVCNDAASLLYVVNQGAFELHTLLTPADRLDHPDQLILDLDPSTPDVADVVAATRAVRAVLDEVGVNAVAKSTGSRGVHVHIPLDGSGHIDDVHDAARRLAEHVVERDPDRFTVAQAKADRGDRVFIDWLRNGYGQHAVAAYSVRARPTAPVALPMDWDEVTAASFDPRRFTVANAVRRLSQKRDPWESFGVVRHSLDDLP